MRALASSARSSSFWLMVAGEPPAAVPAAGPEPATPAEQSATPTICWPPPETPLFLKGNYFLVKKFFFNFSRFLIDIKIPK
jgi:hypothetical protein